MGASGRSVDCLVGAGRAVGRLALSVSTLSSEMGVMSLPAAAINPIIELGHESSAPAVCLTRDFSDRIAEQPR